MTPSRRLTPALFSVLILAVIARGLMPPGCLAEEGLRVDLCTLEGVRTVLVDPGTGELLDEDGGAQGLACLWCAASSASALPGTSSTFTRLSITLGLRDIPRVLPMPQRDVTGLPPARGPPSSLQAHRHFRSSHV